MIGIVCDPRVGDSSVEKNLCNYIEDFKLYQECSCPERELCLHPSLKPACPFYDYANIPWAIKSLFMEKINRLVAIRDKSHLESVVSEYLISKMVKPSLFSEENRNLES